MIIFLRITYCKFSCKLLCFLRFLHTKLLHDCKRSILTYYFQCQKDRLGLPNSVSQTCIDSVSKENDKTISDVFPINWCITSIICSSVHEFTFIYETIATKPSN